MVSFLIATAQAVQAAIGKRISWAGSIAFAFALSASALADIQVSAILEPAHIRLGESALVLFCAAIFLGDCFHGRARSFSP